MAKKQSDRLKRLQRLKGLGVKKGINHIKMAPPKPLPTEIETETEGLPLHFLNYEEDLQNAVPIESVIGGQVIQNEHGQYFNFEARYPLDSNYGYQPLRAMLNIPMQTIATITGDEAWIYQFEPECSRNHKFGCFLVTSCQSSHGTQEALLNR